MNVAPSVVYRALLDAAAVARSKVAAGMGSHVHRFEAREPGSFRVSLTYDSPDGARESGAQTDTYHGHFVKLMPSEQVVEVLAFETTDLAQQGKIATTTTVIGVELHHKLPTFHATQEHQSRLLSKTGLYG
jgi:hypothetical protein